MVAVVAHPLVWGLTLILAALMIAAMWARDRRVSIAILSLLVARYVIVYLL